MKIDRKAKQNAIYCILGVTIFNIVLQLVVNPTLNHTLGAEKFGIIIYANSIIAIFAPAFGMAVNNIQLLNEKKNIFSRGDISFTLLLWGVFSIVISLLLLFPTENRGILPYITVIVIVTMLRCYLDVKYRLKMDFKGYLFYYLILSAGYLFGIAVFFIYPKWYIIYLIGESSVLLYSFITKETKTFQWKITDRYKDFVKQTGILASSYIIYNATINLDRIILKQVVGNIEVSQYYTATLIGKTLALIIGPLNSLILSYLAVSDKKIQKKTFQKIVIVDFILAFIFMIICSVGTYLFMKLFYADFLPAVSDKIILINVGQILSFAASLLLNIILTMRSETFQIYIQGGYAIIFCALAICMSYQWGVWGMVIATIIANILRMISILIIGFTSMSEKQTRK